MRLHHVYQALVSEIPLRDKILLSFLPKRILSLNGVVSIFLFFTFYFFLLSLWTENNNVNILQLQQPWLKKKQNSSDKLKNKLQIFTQPT